MKDESISQQNQKLNITKNKCQLKCFVNGSTLVPKEKSQTFILNSQCVKCRVLEAVACSEFPPSSDFCSRAHHHHPGEKFPLCPTEFALMQVMPMASCQGHPGSSPQSQLGHWGLEQLGPAEGVPGVGMGLSQGLFNTKKVDSVTFYSHSLLS